MRPMSATINPPRHALRAGGIATVLLAVAAPVVGQGGKDESEAEVVEEILVTGQKRAGTLLQSDSAYVLDTKAPVCSIRNTHRTHASNLGTCLMLIATSQVMYHFTPIGKVT